MSAWSPEIDDWLVKVIEDSYKRIDKLELDVDEWNKFADSIPDDIQFQDGRRELHEKCLEIPDEVPWIWRYNDDKTQITIIFYLLTPEQIEYTETHISSPSLKGDWWWPANDFNIEYKEGNTYLTFTPTRHFPILIRGGDDIDDLSATYISSLCSVLRQPEWFIKWGMKSALNGEYTSLLHLSVFFLNAEETDKAAYWLARVVREHQNELCGLTLASMLFKEHCEMQCPQLSELLLAKYADEGNMEALYQLSQLYLIGPGEIEKNEEKALKLLNIGKEAGHEKCIQLLEHYLNSKIDKNTTIIDVALAGGIILLGGVAGFLLFKRFSRK